MQTILVGKTGGTKPLGRPRYRWKKNSKLDLKERKWEAVDWIHLA
jgi:hypothetical protein